MTTVLTGEKAQRKNPKIKVISGGQTGADMGGLEGAQNKGVETGGVAPKGYRTELGMNLYLIKFGLTESSSSDYAARTMENVKSATCIIWFGDETSPGGKCTLRCAEQNNVPVMKVNGADQFIRVAKWLTEEIFPHHDEVVIMVAGNRESKSPGLCAFTRTFIERMFNLLRG